MQKNLPLIVFLVFLLAIVVGAWYFFLIKTAPSTPPPEPDKNTEAAPGFAPAASSTSASTGPLAPPRTPPTGSKEYRNTAYRFSIFYPEDLSVQEYDEGAGARTITFQKSGEAIGFQIFVVPYTASRVSTERFQRDAPSGVMQEPQNLNIDGTFATMFIGRDLALGPTREVWMIHGGYLYEVTAPKALDNWLGNIMLTWKFL